MSIKRLPYLIAVPSLILLCSNTGRADCYDQFRYCVDRSHEKEDTCWERCESRFDHNYEAWDRCTDRCADTADAEWSRCERQEEACDSGSTAENGSNGDGAVPGAEIVGTYQEIPNPQLGDIAMVTNRPDGIPVIIYNPVLCQRLGYNLCEFYKYHEYGHIALSHTTSRRLHPVAVEAEADCWAARHAPWSAVEAGFQWFMQGGGSGLHHGTGRQRAARVQDCAASR
ncbi:hypothetical protein PHA8399_03264 [Leisingera aquaemixtae]|uniref:Uncharacterized protein n=1 Tax=Leisingera aquaemixtae TaxID=1396826 RepID=A0A0P1HCY5_9RHOB|nr:hypothetical protein PHA8399_03264 [Leisingera aquaemixtae]